MWWTISLVWTIKILNISFKDRGYRKLDLPKLRTSCGSTRFMIGIVLTFETHEYKGLFWGFEETPRAVMRILKILYGNPTAKLGFLNSGQKQIKHVMIPPAKGHSWQNLIESMCHSCWVHDSHPHFDVFCPALPNRKPALWGFQCVCLCIGQLEVRQWELPHLDWHSWYHGASPPSHGHRRHFLTTTWTASNFKTFDVRPGPLNSLVPWQSLFWHPGSSGMLLVQLHSWRTTSNSWCEQFTAIHQSIHHIFFLSRHQTSP